jgi:PAS domain S-box-containing protein
MTGFLDNRWDLAPLFLFIGSALLSAGIAIFLSQKKRESIAKSFFLVVTMQGARSLLLVMEMLSSGIEGKLFWDNLQYPVTLGLGSAFFVFSLIFTGRRYDFDIKTVSLLILPAIISGVLAFSDPLHGLIRQGAYIDRSIRFGELVYGFTTVDYILFTWGYGLSVGAIALLLIKRRRVPIIYRPRYNLIIMGFIIPLAGLVPTILDIRIMGRRDISPVWFILCNLLIYLALFRFRLFDIMPLARRTLVESLGNPILVLESNRMILDFNKAFADLVGFQASKIRGQELGRVISAWPRDTREILESQLVGKGDGESSGSISIPWMDSIRHFRITVQAIVSETGTPYEENCKIIVFRDVTQLFEVERTLKEWNSKLERRIEARIQDLKLEVVQRKNAEEELRKINSRMMTSQQEILVTLSELVENRSPETAHHVFRVSEYARILAAACGLTPETVNLIANSAPLHDVGKIAIPDSILNKNGRLSEEEMRIMKRHSAVGYRILGFSERSVFRAAAIIAIEHHERWDGTGYPAGKAGESISISGRIVCICDVIDALATVRPYKPVWEFPRIVDYMAEESGRMFDPQLIKLFLANQWRFRTIAERYPDAQYMNP